MNVTFTGTREKRALPEQVIDLDALSQEQKTWLIERGIEESARNSYASLTEAKCGGAEKAHLEASRAWTAWFNRLRAGEVMRGGGGRQLSSDERRLRFVLAQWFESRGMSATDAQKAARDGRKALEAFVMEAAIAKGVDDTEKVTAAVERHWSKIESDARAMVTADADDIV